MRRMSVHCLVMIFEIATVAAFGDGPVAPSVTIPKFDSRSANDYYPLLLQWTTVLKIGQMQFQVSYLDPSVLLAKAKNDFSDQKEQEAAYTKDLGRFPEVLYIQIAFRSQQRDQLKPLTWKVSLVNSEGAESQPVESRISSDVALTSSATGQWWQEVVVYTFPNVRGDFLPPKTKSLDLKITGIEGSKTARWSFVETNAQTQNSGQVSEGDPSYVRILGWALVVVCAALVVLLWIARPPKDIAS